MERLTAYLKQDRPELVMIQECRLAREHQRGVRAELHKAGYDCHFGEPAPWRKTARGQTRLDFGLVPGVMFAVKQNQTVTPLVPCTPSANEYVKKGRLLLALLHPQGQPPCIVMNMYFPSGKNHDKARQAMEKAIHEEIIARGTDRVIIGGDWNQNPLESQLAQRLLTERLWTIPTLMAPDMKPKEMTSEADGHATWLDSFMVGTGVQCEIPIQTVHDRVGTLHSRVGIQVPWLSTPKHPTLRYPPNLVKREAPESHDWLNTQKRVQEAIVQMHMDPTRTNLDYLWETWIDEYHRYVRANMTSERDPYLGDLGQTAMQCKRSGRHPGLSRPSITSVETCVQAIDRMKQDVPLAGKARSKQLDAIPSLKEHLQVDDSQIEDMLDRPGAYYGE